jgi:hypothetical protein
MEKKDLDKRVRALTTLTKYHKIVDLAARYFNSEHPLPTVCLLSLFAFFLLKGQGSRLEGGGGE